MQTPGFQEREWRLQRAAWAVLATIVALAALGLFGSGPISHARVTDATGRIQIEYERFWRMHAPATLRLHATFTSDADILTVWFDRAYLDEADIRHILPIPRATRAGPGRIEFDFGMTPGARNLLVTISLDPAGVGPRRGVVGLAGGPELRFRQFVYP